MTKVAAACLYSPRPGMPCIVSFNFTGPWQGPEGDKDKDKGSGLQGRQDKGDKDKDKGSGLQGRTHHA